LHLPEQESESLSRSIPVEHASKTEDGTLTMQFFFPDTEITMTFSEEMLRMRFVILAGCAHGISSSGLL
jgi:hypothetical protein